MKQVLLITGGIMLVIGLIVGGFTFVQANREELSLSADLQYRTRLLADSLTESIEQPLINNATTSIQKTVDRIADNERVVGLGVIDNAGDTIAVSKNLPSDVPRSPLVANAMDSDMPEGAFAQGSTGRVYIYVDPLHDDDDRVIGALVIAQNASYIDSIVGNIWRDSLLRLVLQLFFIALALFVLIRWVFFRSLSKLTESIRAMRRGDTVSENAHEHFSFLKPLSSEIFKISTNLQQARFAAREEARMRLEKIDSPWTAERLREFIQAYLKDRPIFVVSNGEPYVNTKVKSKIEWKVPAGGVITAIEPVMEACGGMWIAHGSGNADKEMVDAESKLRVPHEEPKYTLKRVWLTPKEVKGYYNGFSNEALWPLCHMAHVRPQFRSEDWLEYKKVNALFAKKLLEEIRQVEHPIILVQDYHLALVPAMIKKSRPDAQVSIFWHIPWPSAAQFSICPWRREILEGMLGADLVGFHTQQYCNTFMDTVASEVESRIDYEHFSVFRDQHRTFVKPFPISIAFPGNAESNEEPDRTILDNLGIKSAHLVLGVDRLDYIKGIPERFRGFEFLLDSHPEYIGTVTLLQIGSPTRESVEKYQEYTAHVVAEAERINAKFATNDWKPIVLERRSYSHAELRHLYQIADACLVTSLHDGMNLVAKEYVAARSDESGALILSQFTGASRDLRGALIVNPYSAEETAAALHAALTMPKTEQHRRMKTMRASVRDYNIYRWSAELIKALVRLD
ncbi:MAG: trehalose-6-phosphate synthase [Candidatus Paceibacterota bacterium]